MRAPLSSVPDPVSCPAGRGAGGRERRTGVAPSRRLRSSLPGLLVGLGTALAWLLASGAARADLVILSDGGVLKVKAFELEGERARLTFRSGGRMTLAITRIERVIENEVEEAEPVLPAPRQAAGDQQQPAIALRFAASQAVPGGPWGALIYETARRHGINPDLVAAVIGAESAGNAFAVSRVGARGLMQLMPATAERFGIPHALLFDPQQNLEAGSRYLSWLIDQFPGDLARILAAYNAGENAVVKYGGVPPYRETRGYVRRIYAFLGLASTPGATPPPTSPAASTAPASKTTTRVASSSGRLR